MTKVRVQDAAKELSSNAVRALENMTRLRKQSQGALESLRRISDGFVREEKERQEREKKEALSREYEQNAQFMTAYSSEQVPEVPASEPAKTAPEETRAPESEKPAEKAETSAESARPAAKNVDRAPQTARPQPGQRPYGRPA